MNHLIGSWFLMLMVASGISTGVLTVNTLTAQAPVQAGAAGTAASEGRNMEPSWGSLDQAREHHLAGESEEALVILEAIARDTLMADKGLSNARRELTAFVLSAMGQHERAFDTLRVYTTSRIELLDQVHEEERKRIEARMDQLEAELARESMGSAAALSEQRIEARDHLLIAGGIIAMLLIIVLMLALRPRKEVVRPESIGRGPAPPAVAERSSPDPGPATTIAPATPIAPPPAVPIIHAEPMDAAIMQDHVVRISSELNRGGTVEAAGHLGILLRFLRMVTGQVKDGHMPAQDAVAFVRQYLKLETHRMGSKLRYSVDADRKLVDRATPIPAMELLKLLAGLMPEAIRSDGLTVELVPSDVGEGGQCLIRYTLDQTTGSDNGMEAAIARTGLKVEHQQKDSECSIRVEWPDARG